MKTYLHTFSVVFLIATLVSPAAAQGPGFSAADSKELASYRLTVETTSKVRALMRAVMQEMNRDPKFEALQKTKKEIETISKKEELPTLNPSVSTSCRPSPRNRKTRSPRRMAVWT